MTARAVEEESEVRGEEGDSAEQRETEDRDFRGVKMGRGAPAFSDEHEMDIIEFVNQNPLWEQIGEQIGRTGQDGRR